MVYTGMVEVQLQHNVSCLYSSNKHPFKNSIPEFGVDPFSIGDRLGNVCNEADLP